MSNGILGLRPEILGVLTVLTLCPLVSSKTPEVFKGASFIRPQTSRESSGLSGMALNGAEAARHYRFWTDERWKIGR